MSIKRIGFIGVGNMGKPMAITLLKAGFDLTVVDIRPERVPALLAMGAHEALSAREAAEKSEVVISVVQTGEQTDEVLRGRDGVLAGMRSGGIVLISSTVEPDLVRELEAEAAERGVVVLDAAVSGGTWRAKEGKLTVMVGGRRDAYESCLPILQTLGTDIHYFGGIGTGVSAKLINNMLAGVHVVANIEAVRMGMRAGIDAKQLIAMLSTASGANFMLGRWETTPATTMQHGADLMQKDLHLATRFAQRQSLDVPLGSLAAKWFDELDWTSDQPVAEIEVTDLSRKPILP